MAEFDIEKMIERAGGTKKARNLVDLLTGQTGSGGTYNLFRGEKNPPTIPPEHNVGSLPPSGSPFGGPAPMGEAPPVEEGWLPSPRQDTGMVNPMMERWKSDPMLRMKFGNDVKAYMMSQGGGGGPVLD